MTNVLFLNFVIINFCSEDFFYDDKTLLHILCCEKFYAHVPHDDIFNFIAKLEF